MQDNSPPRIYDVQRQMFLGHVDKEQKKFAYLKQEFKEQNLIIEISSIKSIIGTSKKIYTCGLNENGQLWLGHTQECKTFTPLTYKNIKKFSASTCILLVTKEERLYRVAMKPLYGPGEPSFLATGQLIPVPTIVQQVASSANYSAYLTEHRVFIARYDDNSYTKASELTENVKEIGLGGHHFVALTEQGNIYTRGNNKYGQLGQGDYAQRGCFTKVEHLKAQQIAVGTSHTVAVVDNHVYTCGQNDCGQLGVGDKEDHSAFSLVQLEGEIQQIAAGNKHTAAVVNEKLFVWGDNQFGQLGLGDNVPRLTPQKVEVPGKILILKIGDQSTVAVTTEGIFFAGRNDCYQFGNDNHNHNTFTKMNNLPPEIQQIYDEADVYALLQDLNIENNNNNNQP